jgi:hypothetical protein
MATKPELTTGAYRGPERRRHRVFLTRNTEYHCRDDVCVAVRDRATGAFVQHHTALGRRLSGAIQFSKDGRIVSFVTRGEQPFINQSLLFSNGSIETELRTSPLRGISRPPRELIQRYR